MDRSRLEFLLLVRCPSCAFKCSTLDFTNLALMVSLRHLACLDFLLPVEAFFIDLPLPLQSFARCESSLSPSGLARLEFLHVLPVSDSVSLEASSSLQSFSCVGSVPLVLGSCNTGPSSLMRGLLGSLVFLSGLSRVDFVFAMPLIESATLDPSFLLHKFCRPNFTLPVVDFAATESLLFLHRFSYLDLLPLLFKSLHVGVSLPSIGFECMGPSLIVRTCFRSDVILSVLDFSSPALPISLQGLGQTDFSLSASAANSVDFPLLVHGPVRLDVSFSNLELTQFAFLLLAQSVSRAGAAISALDSLHPELFLFSKSFIRLEISLFVVGRSVSGGKSIRNSDGDLRAEVTEAGGSFIGEWTMPSNLANSISSYVRVGFLSVIDSSHPDLTASSQRFSWLDLTLSVCGNVCCELVLLLLDFALFGPILLLQSVSGCSGFFLLISDFVSLGVSSFARGLRLDFLPTTCGLACAGFTYSLPVVDSIRAASSVLLRSSAKLSLPTSACCVQLDPAFLLRKSG